MIFQKVKKSVPVLWRDLLWVFLLTGFSALPSWGAAAGGNPERGSPDRNPFAYPSKIIRETVSLKTGDGKSPASAKSPQKEYVLSGILWTEKGGVASINRRILREGEMLDEYHIVRIDRNKVILKKEGEEIVLNLFQSPVVISEPREPRSSQKKKFP